MHGRGGIAGEGTASAESVARARPLASARSRAPDLALTCAIGAGFLAHPLVGLVGITAVAGALILYPDRLARLLVPALGGGAILAIPQVLTMAGIAAPAWVGAAFIVAGICLAFVLSFAVEALADRFLHAPAVAPPATTTLTAATDRATASGSTDWMRAVLVGSAILFLAVVAVRLIAPSGDPASPSDPVGELMADFPRLFWLCLGGVALSILRLGRGWILLGCGVGAGLAAWAASGIVGHASLTEQAVHYEVPKSVEYWLPVMLALGAAGALAAVYRERRLGLLRPVAIGVFLVVSIYPLTMPLVQDVRIGEHRGAESLGLALREAQDGYWASYPDPRRIIDAPRQEVVDMLRGEEAAGRLGSQTRVLHIASSFQQWVSVPIGVFTGAIETSISCSPEVSIHTEGGRLLGFNNLGSELGSGYKYVVLEPANPDPQGCPRLSAALADQITSAGYRQIWSNSQAIVYTK